LASLDTGDLLAALVPGLGQLAAQISDLIVFHCLLWPSAIEFTELLFKLLHTLKGWLVDWFRKAKAHL
jgi:hypothetical protein